MKYEIPLDFQKTILSVHGEKGREWLAHLPTLLKQCEDLLKINVIEPFTLSYNYVVSCTSLDGKRGCTETCCSFEGVFFRNCRSLTIEGKRSRKSS